MGNNRFCFVIVGLILLMLAGCKGRGGSDTAEQAAAQQVVKSPPDGAVINPGSIKVLQSQAFENSTYVVLTYQRMWNNRDEQCLVMAETHHDPLAGWVAGSGGGSCMDRQPGSESASEPMHVSGGTHSRTDQKKPPISHVLGKVNDPAIVKVKIVWKDGQSQEAQVVQGSFVAIRVSGVEMKSAEGLNIENAVLYLIEH